MGSSYALSHYIPIFCQYIPIFSLSPHSSFLITAPSAFNSFSTRMALRERTLRDISSMSWLSPLDKRSAAMADSRAKFTFSLQGNNETRRRMARERRGAGSSLVSMETQFYKQYMKDVL